MSVETNQKKLNIALALEIFHPEVNGIVTSSVNMLYNLKRRGHKPVIFAPQVLKNSPDEIYGIPVHYLPSLPTYLYPGLHMVRARTTQMRNLFDYYNFDIAHLTAPWRVNRAVLKNAVARNIPLVHTYHTNLHHSSYIKYVFPFAGERGAARGADIFWKIARPYIDPCAHLTTPSHVNRQELAQRYPNKEVHYIPNGVDLQSFSNRIDESLFESILSPYLPSVKSKTNSPSYFVFVGRLGFEKSVDILLLGFAQAIKEAKTRGLDFDYHLLLVGDGPASAKLKEMVVAQGIQKRVHFLGKIDHTKLIKSGLMTRARAFVTASLTEVQSMTVIESICSGTPLIAARHPSMTNLAGEAARYFGPDDIHDLAKAFLDITQDDLLYTKLKESTFSLKESFDGEKVTLQHEELYYKTLAQA